MPNCDACRGEALPMQDQENHGDSNSKAVIVTEACCLTNIDPRPVVELVATDAGSSKLSRARRPAM